MVNVKLVSKGHTPSLLEQLVFHALPMLYAMEVTISCLNKVFTALQSIVLKSTLATSVLNALVGKVKSEASMATAITDRRVYFVICALKVLVRAHLEEDARIVHLFTVIY